MIQGAIFDVDGTLFDSMYIWDTVGEAYLRSLGHEPKENLNETFKTMSLHQAACHYQAEYGVTLSVEAIMNGVNAMVEHEYRHVIRLKPGVAEFLEQLRDVKKCIATATDRYLVEAALERCGIADHFSEIFTCTEVGHGKDEPDIYRRALAHLQTPKAQTIVFEDALYAVRTAKADGFLVAAVYDPHEKNQQALRTEANFYLPDFQTNLTIL